MIHQTSPTSEPASDSGQTWARVTFGLGLTASIAANVGAVVIDTGFAHEGMRWAAIAAVIFWPVLLLATFETVVRVSFGARHWAAAGARYIGLTAVALVAGLTSFTHMQHFLQALHYEGWLSVVCPLAIDGGMLVASLALRDIAVGSRPVAVDQTSTVALVDVDRPAEQTGTRPAEIVEYVRTTEQGTIAVGTVALVDVDRPAESTGPDRSQTDPTDQTRPGTPDPTDAEPVTVDAATTPTDPTDPVDRTETSTETPDAAPARVEINETPAETSQVDASETISAPDAPTATPGKPSPQIGAEPFGGRRGRDLTDAEIVEYVRTTEQGTGRPMSRTAVMTATGVGSGRANKMIDAARAPQLRSVGS